MKIEKETNNNLIITVTKKEFKNAFKSLDQLEFFKKELFKLMGVYYQCSQELRGNNND